MLPRSLLHHRVLQVLERVEHGLAVPEARRDDQRLVVGALDEADLAVGRGQDGRPDARVVGHGGDGHKGDVGRVEDAVLLAHRVLGEAPGALHGGGVAEFLLDGLLARVPAVEVCCHFNMNLGFVVGVIGDVGCVRESAMPSWRCWCVAVVIGLMPR